MLKRSRVAPCQDACANAFVRRYPVMLDAEPAFDRRSQPVQHALKGGGIDAIGPHQALGQAVVEQFVDRRFPEADAHRLFHGWSPYLAALTVGVPGVTSQ